MGGIKPNTQEDTDMEIDFGLFLNVVKKRIWLILGFVCLSCLAAGLISKYYIKPVYQASTVMIVNKSSDAAPGTLKLDITDVALNIKLIDTYKEIIMTPAVMDKVALNHPEFNLGPDQLVQMVKVSSVNETQVMKLVVEDHSYERAVNVVNAVSREFRKQIPLIMKVDNVSILSEAINKPGAAPVQPNVNLNIAMTFAVSLIFVVGLLLLAELMDDRVKTEEDLIKRTGMRPLLTVVRLRKKDLLPKKYKSGQKQAGDLAYVPKQSI
jgi:capsular polysaccharide biosynthesis protein